MGVVHRATWVVPVDGEPIADGEVAVDRGRVVAIGRGLTETPAAQGFSHVDHLGVLAPGLVNAHTHLVYGPAYADLAVGGMPFADWIVQLLPRRRAMSLDERAAQMRLSAALALQTGTTAVGDLVSDGPLLGLRTGLGGRAYHEIAGRDAAGWVADREAWAAHLTDDEPPADADTDAQTDGGRDARESAGISPHTLYTLDDAVVRDVCALARQQGRRLHPHLAETTDEAEFVLAGTGAYRAVNERFALAMTLAEGGSGLTPTQHLDALDGLGPDVHVAHGVHVDAADRELLRRRGTAVALCTRSNAVLGAGEAPVAAYRREGNPVAIGTDSLASCPDLDLLAELRALERLALDQGTDREGLHRWLVEAATVGGARALGIEAGVLASGRRADLVVVQGEGADPYDQLVHGRATTTYLKGERA